MADRFYIGPYDDKSGQDTALKPYLIPDNAFSSLMNAYVFRGRVRKRFGSMWLGNNDYETRLRMSVGTLGAPTSPVPGAVGAIGQMFTIHDPNTLEVVRFTAWQDGAMKVADGSAVTATFDTKTIVAGGTGAFSFVTVKDKNGVTLDNASTIFWYPAYPVMALLTQETSAIVNEKVIAFDTKYAYQYLSTPQGWERLGTESTASAATWIGTNSQFFWGANWRGASPQDLVLFVTNFNENETNFMRFLFGTTWDNFKPTISSTDFLLSARILIPFKNRLVAFNTWEGPTITGTNFPFRCRYSSVGSPLATNAWRADIPGNGNAIDAPTTEAIISAEFVKDRLIVFFERSTWELVYTGNQVFPFNWQQINTELGAESTFSVVPFDKVAIGVGNVGIHACNGANVERIDTKIPDSVFEIHNANEGVARVYGIRDYKVEMIYWTFPGVDTNTSFPYPNRNMVYNYTTGTWAFNEESITVFGYYQPAVGITWDSTNVTWDDDVPWDDGSLQAQFREVIGGNQEGWTFIVDPDTPRNAPALYITDISATDNVATITAVNHNLRQGEFVFLEGIESTVDGNGDDLDDLNDAIFKVSSNPIGDDTPNTFQVIYNESGTLGGTYDGAGIVSRVSNIEFDTKQYNFYADKGRNVSIDKISFLVDKTTGGEITVDALISTSQADLNNTGSSLGTQVLETFPYTAYFPYEATADRLWHPVYFDAEGEYIQFRFYMTDAQMMKIETDADGNQIAPGLEDFELHGMIIYAEPTSSRLQ